MYKVLVCKQTQKNFCCIWLEVFSFLESFSWYLSSAYLLKKFNFEIFKRLKPLLVIEKKMA